MLWTFTWVGEGYSVDVNMRTTLHIAVDDVAALYTHGNVQLEQRPTFPFAFSLYQSLLYKFLTFSPFPNLKNKLSHDFPFVCRTSSSTMSFQAGFI